MRTHSITDKSFIAGFGIAIVELIKLHGDDGTAGDVIDNCAYTIEHFKAAGLEADDIAILRKALQR